jgi:hypothetical protein
MDYITKKLNKDNIYQYCSLHYRYSSIFEKEMIQDIKKISKLKKMIGKSSEREILNILIMSANVFGVLQSMRIILFFIGEELFLSLKQQYVYLEYLSDFNMKFIEIHDGIRI